MPTVRLTRNYRFAASHRLHLASLSDEENRRMFGKCNNPYGHGHNYVLSITVAGSVNPETGLVVDPFELDRLVERHVVAAYDHKYLNSDVAEFDAATATTENMVTGVQDRLRAVWPESFPELAAIRIQETKRNVVALPIIEGRV